MKISREEDLEILKKLGFNIFLHNFKVRINLIW